LVGIEGERGLAIGGLDVNSDINRL
jgi:hypothetical protein